MTYVNTNKRKAWMAILIYKMSFSVKNIMWDKGSHFIVIKVLGYQESKQILNIYAINNRASNTWSKTLKTARRKTKQK